MPAAMQPRVTSKRPPAPPGRLDDPFVAAVAAYLAGGEKERDRQRDAVARTFYESERIKKIVSYQAYNQSLDGENDEICQEMVVLLFDKVLPELDNAVNVYTMLSKVAQLTGFGLKRSLLMHSGRFTSLDIGADKPPAGPDEALFHRDDGEMANADEHFMEKVEHRMTRKALFKDLSARVAVDPHLGYLARIADGVSAEVTFPLVEGAPAVKRPDLKRGKAEDSKMPEDSVELAAIREKLGLSIGQFAAALNIGDSSKKGTLAAYLYGRTKKVPEKVMAAARELLAGRGNLNAKAEAAFGDRTIGSIVQAWGKQLGLPEEVLAERLADLLGVSVVTVKRWLSDKHRPALSEISRCDAIVQAMVARAYQFDVNRNQR